MNAHKLIRINNILALDKLPRNAKRFLMLFADLVIIPCALWSAFALRLGTVNPDITQFWWMFPLAPIISIPIFIKLGLYHAVVRFMGTHAIYAVLKGVTLAAYAIKITIIKILKIIKNFIMFKFFILFFFFFLFNISNYPCSYLKL